MVFLCFRSKKATKDEELIGKNENRLNNQSKKPNNKTAAKSTRHPQDRKAVPVKLAPRTTLLKTPKQVVGARIARALHDKQNPDLENMDAEIKRHSRSPSPTRIPSPSHSLHTEDQLIAKEKEVGDGEKTSKPTSPKLRTSSNMLASNGVQTSELMEALARRAARQADRKE